ncbi:MAG TPA: hypothetical protein VGQ37_19350 [Vicinamibacterales bacterium]|jgi:hypothetical protein|nr:hypothetical protein [Vicinamibacterales bacterium]
MTRARATATTIAAFLVAQIAAVLVHGFILSADYEPYEGTLLRAAGTGTPPWQMLFLPVVHLSVIVSLVWVYGRIRLAGSMLSRGLQLGVLGWTMGQLPVWLQWYAEQPWPGNLVLKQIGLELAASLAIGVTIAAVARLPARIDEPMVARV